MNDADVTDYRRIKQQVKMLSEHMIKRIHWIILATVIAGVGGYSLSYLISPKFESKSRFILGRAGISASQFGSLASLAGLSGRSDGDPSIFNESTLEDLIRSPHVTEELIKAHWNTLPENGKGGVATYSLLRMDSTLLKVPHPGISKAEMCEQKMRGALAGAIEIKKSPSGIWTLVTTAYDPIVAVEMNDRILDILRKISENEKFNKGIRNRKFLERRFSAISDELRDLESDYGRFLSANRGLQDPNLQHKQRAFQRNIQMKEGVFAEVGKQLELARIEEAKEQVSLVVFETPNMPLYRTRPRRMQIAIASGLLGAGLISALFIVGGLKKAELEVA